MATVSEIKDMIMVDVRLALLRLRKLENREDQMNLMGSMERSLAEQLDNLVAEASLDGFMQGQENILEAMSQ